MRFYSVTQPIDRLFPKVKQDLLEEGIARGNAVHAYCSAAAKGEWVPKPMEGGGYCYSFDWWKENLVDEILLVDYEFINRAFYFVGHIDLMVRMKGNTKPIIVDLKTPRSKSKLWKMQLAAYHYLASQEGYDLGTGGSLRLDPFGREPKMSYYENTAIDLKAFLELLDIHRYLES